MSEEAHLITELENGVLTITLNRPKANAFNTEMAKALTKVFKGAARNEDVRVVLLIGAGKFFSGDGKQISVPRSHQRRQVKPGLCNGVS